MAKKAKVNFHVSLFDWRVAMSFGFLFGVVIATAPDYVGAILLLGMIMLSLKMVERGRI